MSQAKFRSRVDFGNCGFCGAYFCVKSIGKKRKFCSRICFHKSVGKREFGKIKKPVTFKCYGCGVEKIVPRNKSEIRNKYGQQCRNRYCSYECSRDSKRKKSGKTRHCHICGNELSITTKRKKRTCRECLPNYRAENKHKRKITDNLRTRVSKLLLGKIKSGKTFDLVGCSSEMFFKYIQGKFLKGMTWDNYGKVWHLDHIVPCASFDLTSEQDQKKCFHYSNHQPLFASDNLSKGDKIIECQPELLIVIK